MGIIVLTHITTDLIIIVPITGRTPGAAGIDIIAIVTLIITGAKNDRNSHTGLARNSRASLNYFPCFGEPACLAAGPLPGSSSWNSCLNC
jgi:hypothetical protein